MLASSSDNSAVGLWLCFIAVGSLSLYIIGYNWLRHLIMAHRRKRGDNRSESGIILLGPLFGMVAAGLLLVLIAPPPVYVRLWWLWIPWLLDEQTWAILYTLLFFHPRRWWRARRSR